MRRFTIVAEHPAYAGTIVADRSAPDFRNCDMSGDPVFKAEPRRVTLYETGDLQLVGYTFSSFWRPNTVPVRVGQRVENGLHLLQLFTKYRQRTEEVLVVYPADGYWRARPLPPPHLGYSAYGSSFLLGPVEPAGRPFVDIKEIVFDPADPHLPPRLRPRRQRQPACRAASTRSRSSSQTASTPRSRRRCRSRRCARCSSPRPTPTRAEATWLSPGAAPTTTAPVMDFRRANVTEFRAGRRLPSRHNTSAPDMVFRDFGDAP